jgi:glutamate formiminotransferase
MVTMKLIESVINISEGQDLHKIERIKSFFISQHGITLLDVYSGASTNRSVFTIVGEPIAMERAIFELFELISEIIDMRLHHGSHPRIGAIDVCPLIPLFEINKAECQKIALSLATHISNELGIPIYLYADSAQNEERKKLSFIRQGGYESLKERPSHGQLLKPDFGELTGELKSGASIIGVRDILVAYNITLDTEDLTIAKKIASLIRESNIDSQDRLSGCQALGWFIPEYRKVQISCNLINVDLITVYQKVQLLAEFFHTKVLGSELIGLLPMRSLFKDRQVSKDLKWLEIEKKAIENAERINLSLHKKFNARRQILEAAALTTHKLI